MLRGLRAAVGAGAGERVNARAQANSNTPEPEIRAMKESDQQTANPPRAGRHCKADAWRWCLIALLLPVLVVTGCATPGSGSRPPKRGEGLREYQHLVLGLRKAVTASRQSLETLAATGQGNAAATYARFDASLHRLEVVSIKARARAEAMEQRGEAYFEEWAEEMSGSADAASRRAAKARFAELHRHFEAILGDSRQVRQEFRPFLDGVRRMRTSLGPKPEFEAIAKAGPDFAQLVAAGRQAAGKMDQLSKTLKTAEAAVMAGALPPMKSGGKS